MLLFYPFGVYGGICSFICISIVLFFKPLFKNGKQFKLTVFNFYMLFLFGIIITTFAVESNITKSPSMEGTLKVGEISLTNNIAYGFRDSISRSYFINWKLPQRGDIVKITIPKETNNKYLQFINEENKEMFDGQEVGIIKRLVATPRDRFYFKDAKLYLHPSEGNDYVKEHYRDYELFNIDGNLFVKEPYRNDDTKIQFIENADIKKAREVFPEIYNSKIITLKDNEYFLVGDNRNDSLDSRLYGAVPLNWIVGKVIKI